jgi:hypothetical protein
MTLLEGAQHFLVVIVKHRLEICTNYVFAELKFLVRDNLIGVGYPAYIFVIHNVHFSAPIVFLSIF